MNEWGWKLEVNFLSLENIYIYTMEYYELLKNEVNLYVMTLENLQDQVLS